MTTLVIDREMLPETLLSIIGTSRIRVESEAERVVLTPETEADEPYIDGPDSDYIDPADYPDTTAYLNAIPGMVESILKSTNAPASEFKPAPRHLFHV